MQHRESPISCEFGNIKCLFIDTGTCNTSYMSQSKLGMHSRFGERPVSSFIFQVAHSAEIVLVVRYLLPNYLIWFSEQIGGMQALDLWRR
jgi:hypothetical protein